MSKGVGEGKMEYATITEELEAVVPGLVAKANAGSRAAKIRLKCFDCMGGHFPKLVKECPVKDCWLWDVRLGRVTRKK